MENRKMVENALIEAWGEQGKKIIEEAKKNEMNYSFDEFLEKDCFACGGDLNQLLLSGIKKLFPTIWNLIPNQLGKNGTDGAVHLLFVLQLCGIYSE